MQHDQSTIMNQYKNKNLLKNTQGLQTTKMLDKINFIHHNKTIMKMINKNLFHNKIKSQ